MHRPCCLHLGTHRGGQSHFCSASPSANTTVCANACTDAGGPTRLHHTATVTPVNTHTEASTPEVAGTLLQPTGVHPATVPLLLARKNKHRSHCHCLRKQFGWHHPWECCDQWSRNTSDPPAEQGPNLDGGENKELGPNTRPPELAHAAQESELGLGPLKSSGNEAS